MIDIQRFFDYRLVQAVGFGSICAIAGVVLGVGVTITLRQLTAKELADKWFGELQKKFNDLTHQFSQAKITIADQAEKMAGMVGYSQRQVRIAQQVAERYQELADQPTTEQRAKRRTA